MDDILTYHVMSNTYSWIAQNFYSFYKDYDIKLSQLCGNKSWDFAEHTAAQNEQYQEFDQLKYRSAIIATVFEAFAIEAYINLYYIKVFNIEDRKSTWKKISDIFTHYGYIYEDEPIQPIIRKLFEKRDKLVHYRTKGFPLDCGNTSIDEIFEDIYEHWLFVYEDIDLQMKGYDILIARIAEADNSGKDVVTSEIEKLREFQDELTRRVIKQMLFT